MNQTAHTTIGIVADDLTSATDGAAPFLRKAGPPLIMRLADGSTRHSVVSMDTNSRNMQPDRAKEAVAAAIVALKDRPILYKTMDSTLRGHISVEIEAAFRASERRRLVVAPAFPAARRTTLNGTQFVHGIAVHESAYGRDPVHPARTSLIADLLVSSLGKAVIVPASEDSSLYDNQILILDADNQETLNRQVAGIASPHEVLWVGSPGLAIALAAGISMSAQENEARAFACERVLIVAGSANPVTHAQCDQLQAHGIATVTTLANAPADAKIVCLRAMLESSDPARLLSMLTDEAAAAISHYGFDAVIATGGETMAAVLDRLGINSFRLVGEHEPGFPIACADREGTRPLLLSMKAGGFGSPDTLLRAAKEFALKML